MTGKISWLVKILLQNEQADIYHIQIISVLTVYDPITTLIVYIIVIEVGMYCLNQGSVFETIEYFYK